VEDAFKAIQRTEARYKQPVDVAELLKQASGEDGAVTKESLSKALFAKKVVLSEPEIEALLHKFSTAGSISDLTQVYGCWRESNLPLTTKEKAFNSIRSALTMSDPLDAVGLGDTEPTTTTTTITNIAAGPAKGGKKEKRNMLTLFQQFDLDASGTLSSAEIQKALESLGVRLSKETFASLFRDFDVDGSGSVKYAEFVHGVMVESQIEEVFRQIQKSAATTKNKLDLKAPFNEFDRSGDGSLSKKEFRLALFKMKVRVSEDTMDAIFKHFDPDNSGNVKYAEFAQQFFNRKKVIIKDLKA
jgi:Ca2+-binding EF-hand superfamily protein